MGFSSTIWFPNIEQLAKTYKVYALDFIGDLNKSIPVQIPVNKEECREWLDDVLNELGIDSCFIGGISYGGFLAINYAIYTPHRVSKLFLLSPASSFVPLHEEFTSRIFTMAANPMKKNVDQFIEWLSSYQINKTLVDQFHAAFRYGSLIVGVPPGIFGDDELESLSMPILLILGDQEVISDADMAYHRAVQLCGKIRAEILPGAGHLLNVENPEHVNQIMDEFLCNELA